MFKIYTLDDFQLEVMKSDLQIKLEQQGCIFKGQEALSNHEEDLTKPCYCNRPNFNK